MPYWSRTKLGSRYSSGNTCQAGDAFALPAIDADSEGEPFRVQPKEARPQVLGVAVREAGR